MTNGTSYEFLTTGEITLTRFAELSPESYKELTKVLYETISQALSQLTGFGSFRVNPPIVVPHAHHANMPTTLSSMES